MIAGVTPRFLQNEKIKRIERKLEKKVKSLLQQLPTIYK